MQDTKDKPLGRFEATRVCNWLRDEKGKTVNGGWTAVHKLTANEIAQAYSVKADDIVRVAKLDVKV